MDPLYSLCRQADGYHWLLMWADGKIVAESGVGFPTREEALADIGVQKQQG